MQGDGPPVIDPPTGPIPRPPGGIAPPVLGALARLAGARVMIVEDDADSREFICAILRMAGVKVLCVGSVAEAIECVYHSFDPDVVVTDFSMPDADGFDLIREFRKAPSSRPIAVPILILSGHSEENWHER